MYGNETGLAAYWTARGYTPAPSGNASQLLQIATIYIDALGWRALEGGGSRTLFAGTPTSAAQATQWPRKNAVDVYGNPIDENTVPVAIEHATYEAAYFASQNDGALNTVFQPNSVVQSEKVDVLETKYFQPKGTEEGGRIPTVPMIPAVEALLMPLLNSSHEGHTFVATGPLAV